MEEKRATVKQFLELAKVKESKPAKKRPITLELLDGKVGEHATVSVINEGTPKHELIETIKTVVDEIGGKELDNAYEHVDLLVAGLQEINPHHVPKWFVRKNADARRRAKKIILGMKKVHALTNGLPEEFQRKAAATYIVTTLQRYDGDEIAEKLIEKAVEEKRSEYLERILRFGRLSRNTVGHVAKILLDNRLGDQTDRILDLAEDALWKTVKKRKGSYRIASTVLQALNEIEDPKMLNLPAAKSRNGKTYPLLEEIEYRLKKIREDPHDAEYHADKIRRAVHAARKEAIPQWGRGKK